MVNNKNQPSAISQLNVEDDSYENHMEPENDFKTSVSIRNFHYKKVPL